MLSQTESVLFYREFNVGEGRKVFCLFFCFWGFFFEAKNAGDIQPLANRRLPGTVSLGVSPTVDSCWKVLGGLENMIRK